MNSIVIVGAGECGGRAALSLRERGYTGAVTLIGAEDHPPYERPPLSKDGIVGNVDPRFVAGLGDYTAKQIDLRLSASVTRLDRASRVVELDDGTLVPYTKLLLATGARARSLPGSEVNSPRILSLRTHADALRIRQHLTPGSRLAILGGGFIGLELAASARRLGATVVLLEGLPRILSRGVPAEIAAAVAARHSAEGVEIICSARVETLRATDEDIRLTLSDGGVIEADLFVVGIGSLPNVELAAEAGLAIDNGIAVDRHLQTSDQDIWAAGDCCSFPLAHYGDRRVRLESWRSAQEHALIAAANLLGASDTITAVPWFWSDQFDLTLQVAGLSTGSTRAVRRDLGNGAFIIFEMDDAGLLLAASGIGPGNAVARDIRLAEMLIASGRSIDAQALASPDVRLKALLAA
ncbi:MULTISPECIES: NAD(P)/FAD-dependent oxidoreductase [unclassified Rhizobium]|uniref:NAD(P)/FAD-dependent oxidoreductase n=1 Tax=unclassified Rhizobium TaxID=2613769 RepID=UPI001ADBEA6C|nr:MULTISPECIES: FAD-dependent oxidoreductase [unclassified Rhizobium]MBO9123778.1 FAD-dependent oxidoreductase [Rhizobium sp. 16-488-2b]MBO9174310.1 FAD-dependent oxidoreductase [Rhizobium sp. 16-488-2a]